MQTASHRLAALLGGGDCARDCAFVCFVGRQRTHIDGAIQSEGSCRVFEASCTAANGEGFHDVIGSRASDAGEGTMDDFAIGKGQHEDSSAGVGGHVYLCLHKIRKSPKADGTAAAAGGGPQSWKLDDANAMAIVCALDIQRL